MPDTHDDCMTIVANARRRQGLVARYGRALRKAKDHDEAVEIHTALMLEVGFVQSDLCKLEAWLRAAKACDLHAPQMLAVPGVTLPLAAEAIERGVRSDHPELPLRVTDPRDWAKAAANDVEDQDDG